jgi:hypothetical protein
MIAFKLLLFREFCAICILQPECAIFLGAAFLPESNKSDRHSVLKHDWVRVRVSLILKHNTRECIINKSLVVIHIHQVVKIHVAIALGNKVKILTNRESRPGA